MVHHARIKRLELIKKAREEAHSDIKAEKAKLREKFAATLIKV